MAVQYWDYWNTCTPTSTGTNWGNWSGTTTSTTSNFWPCSTIVTIQKYLLSGFDDWSATDRADFTRLINDETQTGFTVEMWISGDIDVVDPTIQIHDLDWLMMRLRQVANATDYARIASFVDEVRKRLASVIAARSDETAQQAQPEGQERGAGTADAQPTAQPSPPSD